MTKTNLNRKGNKRRKRKTNKIKFRGSKSGIEKRKKWYIREKETVNVDTTRNKKLYNRKQKVQK